MWPFWRTNLRTHGPWRMKRFVLGGMLLVSGCALFRTRAKEAEICQPPASGALLCFYRNQQTGHWDNVDVVVNEVAVPAVRPPRARLFGRA